MSNIWHLFSCNRINWICSQVVEEGIASCTLTPRGKLPKIVLEPLMLSGSRRLSSRRRNDCTKGESNGSTELESMIAFWSFCLHQAWIKRILKDIMFLRRRFLPDYAGENESILHNRCKEEYVWNTWDHSGWLILPCQLFRSVITLATFSLWGYS